MKILAGLVIGILLHMLYCDLAVYSGVKAQDECLETLNDWYHSAEREKLAPGDQSLQDKLKEFDEKSCKEDASKVIDNFKGKMFGLYRLAPYKNTMLQWRME